MDDRPSIFEQLTPADDALRDDLVWLDSLVADTEAHGTRTNSDPAPEQNGDDDRHVRASTTHEPDETATTAEPAGIEPDPAVTRATPAPSPDTDMREPAPADTMDLESVAAATDGTDTTARSGVKTIRFAALGVVITMAALLCALVAFHMASATGRQDADDRIQTSMGRLETWTAKSRTLLDKADEYGLTGRGTVESLQSQTEKNESITGRPRTGLSTGESDALADRADKAVERTQSLYAKVSKLVKAKPLEDAKTTCSTALDKARKAAAAATASDDATRTALDTLNGLITKTEGFTDDTTVRQWTEMASSLDQARDTLAKALDAKAKADEAAKAQADTERQTQQTEPQASPSAGQQYTTPQYSESGGATDGGTSSGTQSEGSADTGTNGWYVPPATGDDSLPDNDSSL